MLRKKIRLPRVRVRIKKVRKQKMKSQGTRIYTGLVERRSMQRRLQNVEVDPDWFEVGLGMHVS